MLEINNLLSLSGKINSGKDTVYELINYFIDTDDLYKDFSIGRFEQWKGFRNPMKERYTNVKFAEALKAMVCLLIGCTRDQLEDQEFKDTVLGEEWVKYRIITRGLPNYYVSTLEEAEANARRSNQRYVRVTMTPRLLMQLLGTECGRNIIHPDVWVNSVFARYKPDTLRIGKVLQKTMPKWIITDVRFPNELEAIKVRGGVTIRLDGGDRIKNDLIEHISETALDNAKFDYVLDTSGDVKKLAAQVITVLKDLQNGKN